MFRAILYLIVSVLVISVLRSIIGVVLKGFSDLFSPSATTGPSRPRPTSVPAGGELKKDPVCGTFIAAATAPHKTVGGETYYFCSPQCRDKFK
jgi:YHS domain-containing protein